ncbi:MAG: hypothetical protein J6O49_18320, partial [Bacteroidaceae bacterium]|nr:hypothetical protein [Bacteroidaceae bacterium]
KWNRILAFLLSIALVTTTFGSDFASAKVYAEENEIVEESDETEEPEEPKEETTIAELPAAEVIPQDELGGGNENGSGNSENDEEGTTPVVTSTEGNGEGTPTPGDPVDTTDQPEYELDEDGNPVLDENGNPKLKEKVAEEETEEEVVETEEEVDGIKIYYVVSDEDAGYVDNDSDVFAEGKEIVGSTAFENDGYTFLNWTDEDGNEVCDVPNFTPSASDLGVSEDAEGEESEDGEEEVKEVTFTANFKAIINKEVVREVEMDGVLITFSAEPGVLPNDAQFEVIRVYPNVDKAIEEDLSNELDKEIEVKETISFDINIYASSCATEDNEKGYIPLEDGIVEVTFSNVSEAVSSAADADTGLAVYHVDGSDVELQNYEEESTGDEISFDAEHFSTYTVTIYGTNGSAPSFKAKTYISGTNTEINTGASGTAANITVNGRKSANEVAPNLTALGYVFEKAVPADHTGRVITEFERNSSSKIKYWYNEGRNSSTFNSSTGQSANTIRVYFYYKKVVTVTAKLIDKDVNEIAQPESFVINTEADLAKIKPSNLEITAANGSKYSYKGAFVYDSTYSEWGEVQSYELYENDVYAIYGDGIYDYVQLTNANHSYPYVYFEYEPASTSGSFNAQVVYEYSNGYGSTSTITLADPITFTVDENFNVPNDIKPAETDIYKDGTHYQYEKAQVKDGYTWYEVTGYSRSGASVIATYRSGNSNKTAKLGTNNFRFRYKKIAPNANTSLGHHLDLGFKNESEFLKYKNAGASIKAIVNGKSYDMDIVQQS